MDFSLSSITLAPEIPFTAFILASKSLASAYGISSESLSGSISVMSRVAV